MQSGGNSPGPKDYKLQFRQGVTGEWADVSGTTLTVANDWSTGVLDSVVLPAACNDQNSLFLRWIMTSNTNSQGATVASSGINKIDDIYLTGKILTTGMADNSRKVNFSISPNPSNGRFVVESQETISSVTLFNAGGKCVFSNGSVQSRSITLKLDSIPRGTYLLKIHTPSGKEGTQKMVIL